MYNTEIRSRLKHWDFFLIDMFSLQFSFFLASLFILQMKNYTYHDIYRNEAISLMLALCFQAFLMPSYKSILRRSFVEEIRAVLRSAVFMMVVNLGILYFLHVTGDMSRLVFGVTWILYVLMTMALRYLWKRFLLHRVAGLKDAKAVIVLTDSANVGEAVEELTADIFRDLFVAGVFLDDVENATRKEVVPVLGGFDSALDYICQSWVDEVFICLPEKPELQKSLEESVREMGITVHRAALKLGDFEGESSRQHVEMIGRYVVLTQAVRVVSFGDVFLKRLLDIAGALVGCAFTCVLFVFVAPAIKAVSRGPIIFSQTRIGKNGKEFRMYKFRTMDENAEQKKAELLEQNEFGNGLMFKMKRDPRIIGYGKSDRKGRPKGIGYFLRRTSLDEFPQFFNVLKGDMSIVGTRPPLPEEWQKYQYHHRVRMGIRPGITGLWQVSGRNDITDFEEVVRLDSEYIQNWSLILDLKIIFRTVGQLLRASGE